MSRCGRSCARAISICLVLCCSASTQQALAADKVAAIARVPFSNAIDDGGSRGDDVGAPPLFPLQLIVNSFLNGSVQFNFASNSVGVPPATASVAITGVDISGVSIFDEFGDYVFVQPQQAGSAQLRAGSYTVSVTPTLTPAVVGLGSACDFNSTTEVTVGADGTVDPASIEITCGTPTIKLSPATLDLASAASLNALPAILTGNDLFSVCLGNGGSNTLFNFPDLPSSDIGSGVRFVEDVLSLPALINSGGEGITLYCKGMGNSPLAGGVVDEPLWAYLVRLDILKTLDLAGGDETPGIGGYGNEEVSSLLAPYQALIDASNTPYGVLNGTPTQRLQFLEFSYNSFNTPQWSELWRISTANNYTVGDTRSLNNFGIIYSFGIQIDVSQAALDLIVQAGVVPVAHIEPAPFGAEEGISAVLEFPLNQQTALSFGPFDLGNSGEDPLFLKMLDVPPGVGCNAVDFTLENGLSNLFDGHDYRPYGTTQPLTISCELRAETSRVAVTVAFPDIGSFNFPVYDGQVLVEVFNSSGKRIHDSLVVPSADIPEFFFSLSNLADGDYSLQATLGGETSTYAFGCENGGAASFSIAQGDVELGIIQCSETTTVASIGSGLVANCLRSNNIDFLHELKQLSDNSELNCANQSGAQDFVLLRRPIGARTLNLSNSGLGQEDLIVLQNAGLNDASFSKLRIAGNPGLASLTNAEYLSLLNSFDQVDTGAVAFPSGAGVVAQCLRNNNFAAFDDSLVFVDGDLLDCAGISGTDDFDELRNYLRRKELINSVWDFSNTNLDRALLRSFSEAVKFTLPRKPRIILSSNPVTQNIGNIDYLNFARSFDVIDLGSTPFPNLTYVKASDPQIKANFGENVALNAAGDTMIVSAPRWSGDVFNRAGKIYFFERDTTGAWQQAAAFTPSLSHQRDDARYGEDVNISADGNFALASRSTANPDVRAVDIFARSSTTGAWSIETNITRGPQFGAASTFYADAGIQYLFVTDPSALGVFAQQTGEAYAYRRGSFLGQPVWQFLRTYQPISSAADAGDQFGASIAIQPDGRVLIGAPGDDSQNTESTTTSFGTALANNDELDSGAVYLFPDINSSSTSYAYFKDAPGQILGQPNEFGRIVATNSSRIGLFASRNQSLFLGTDLFLQSAGTAFSKEGSITRDSQPPLSMVAADSWLLRSLDLPGGVQLELVSTLTGTPFKKLHDFESIQTQQRRDDNFGQVLAISKDGDIAAFGAVRDDSGAAGIGGDENDVSMKGAGAVYVYP